MRIVEPHQHQIGTRSDIGGDRRLGADVLPALLVDANLDAGRLGEFLRIGEPLVFIALDEGRPAQKAQAGAFLGLEGDILGLGRGEHGGRERRRWAGHGL